VFTNVESHLSVILASTSFEVPDFAHFFNGNCQETSRNFAIAAVDLEAGRQRFFIVFLLVMQ
jgi:hypothetical protein